MMIGTAGQLMDCVACRLRRRGQLKINIGQILDRNDARVAEVGAPSEPSPAVVHRKTTGKS